MIAHQDKSMNGWYLKKPQTVQTAQLSQYCLGRDTGHIYPTFPTSTIRLEQTHVCIISYNVPELTILNDNLSPINVFVLRCFIVVILLR